jgi:excisionase family DNA binding protein
MQTRPVALLAITRRPSDAVARPGGARVVRCPVNTPPRPIEAFVHGLNGAVALIEGPEAMALISYCGLDSYSRQHRGADPRLDRAVAKLLLVSAAFRAGTGSALGTFRTEPPEPVTRSDGRLTTGQAASLLGVTPRAVRKAITEGRLPAERSGSRWLIDADNVALYRAG